jgi:hypothetical protein
MMIEAERIKKTPNTNALDKKLQNADSRSRKSQAPKGVAYWRAVISASSDDSQDVAVGYASYRIVVIRPCLFSLRLICRLSAFCECFGGRWLAITSAPNKSNFSNQIQIQSTQIKSNRSKNPAIQIKFRPDLIWKLIDNKLTGATTPLSKGRLAPPDRVWRSLAAVTVQAALLAVSRYAKTSKYIRYINRINVILKKHCK